VLVVHAAFVFVVARELAHACVVLGWGWAGLELSVGVSGGGCSSFGLGAV